MIFLTVPEMTRRGAQISVSFLVDGLPERFRRNLTSIILLAAALVCLICAWIAGAETWRQYVRGIETISAFPVLKWWISIFVPYGLLGSSIYFFRQFLGETPAPAPASGGVGLLLVLLL